MSEGAFGLSATMFANSVKIQPHVSALSIALSLCLSPAGWASFFPLRNKWINSSESRPPRGTISRAEKGETECRKRGEGKRQVFTLNADQLEGPGSVCVCPEFSHRAQAHLALLDNTTGLLAPQEKKQNFPLLRIQS